MRRAEAKKGAVDAKSLQAIIPSNTWRLDLKRLHPEIYHFPRWHMHNPPLDRAWPLGRTPRLTSFTSAWIYSSSHSECSALKFSTQLCLEYMRQCQIRVRFESRGRLFFKALVKRFWMAKYAPIIIIWCIERGFYKRITWSPVLGVFTNALITWQRKCLC